MSRAQIQTALRNGTRRAVDARSPEQLAIDRVAESKRALNRAQRDRAMAAIKGTPGGAGGRIVRQIETMRAGAVQEIVEQVHALDWCEQYGDLDRRQLDAMWTLQGYYSKARSPCRVTGSYGTRVGGAAREMTDAEAEAWSRYQRLLSVAPAHTRHALALLATSEYPVMCDARALMREGATVLADHLRLARDSNDGAKK